MTDVEVSQANVQALDSGAILRWVSAGRGTVLDGGKLRPPKRLILEAVWDTDPPTWFTVCEWHESWVARLRQRWRDRPFEQIAKFRAVEDGAPGYSHSDRDWDLPAANPIRGKRRFRFTDQSVDSSAPPTRWSGRVTSARFGDVAISPIPKVSYMGVGLEVGLTGTVRTSVDPEIALVLLVPWGDRRASLLSYMSAYVSSLRETLPDLESVSPDGLVDVFGAPLRPELPEGWEMWMEPDRVVASPEADGTFSVRIQARSPGTTMFAVAATDVDQSGDTVVSDVVTITLPPSAWAAEPDALRAGLEVIDESASYGGPRVDWNLRPSGEPA